MEFVQVASILGGLLSVISAFLSFQAVKKRLDIERDLDRKLHIYLELHYDDFKTLKNAKNKEEIKDEIDEHLIRYEKILNEILISMPDEKRVKIDPALNQKSVKGKVAYISKIISRSLVEV